jgi:hypothetical protein
MNRYDDGFMWGIIKYLIAPVIAAVMTGAVIWGSVKEKITNLETIHAGSRLDRIEVAISDMRDDLQDIKHDNKEILRRVK